MQGLGNSLFAFLLFIVVMYFFLIRPQQKQNKERQQMLNSLEKGDKIVTAGGIHGRITSIKDETVNIEIAPNIVITLEKNSVGYVKHEEEKPRKGGKKKNSKNEAKNEAAEAETANENAGPEFTAQEETGEAAKSE